MPGGAVRWRVHLASTPERVYSFLATDEGRAWFWAESAVERDGAVEFRFPNGMEWRGTVTDAKPARRFALDYFGSETVFELGADGAGGTDLTLTAAGVPAEHLAEVRAGWVSVLLALKAACDFGVDLRNHDRARTWSQGFADN